MNLFYRFALSFLFIISFYQAALAEDNLTGQSVAPPLVLDIDDPFSRDLKRAADEATGGISFDDISIGTAASEESGRALLGRDNRLALLASKFRVMGVAVSNNPQSREIFLESPAPTPIGTKPLMNYLRLGSHDSADGARQQAINLVAMVAPYLDTAFIIRSTQDGSDLDIGPFADITHAERYCDLLLDITYGLVRDCYVVQEFPNITHPPSFRSKAMLRFSTDAIVSVIEDASVFDLPRVAEQIITIGEGEYLGVGDTMVVKILPAGVVIVDEIGIVATLPLSYIPEDELAPPQQSQNINLPEITINAPANVDNATPRTAADIILESN